MRISSKVDLATLESTLTIDGVPYRLFYNFAATLTFYKATGINPVIEPLGNDPLNAAALLWVGLLHYQPEIELAIVQSWFIAGSQLELYKAASDAFRAVQPEPQPASEGSAADPLSA